jgi:uncharacterized protein YbaP (TraB family)
MHSLSCSRTCRRLLSLWLLFFCLNPFANATPQAERTNDGPLFKIERDGHVAWLFGTIHVGAPNVFQHNALLGDAFRQSRGLALESDPRNMQRQMPAVMKTGMYAPGSSLEKDVSPKTLQQLLAIVHDDTSAYEQMLQFKPWLLTLQLTLLYTTNSGLSPEDGADQQLLKTAVQQKFQIKELEDATATLHTLSNMPMSLQVQTLQYTVNQFDQPHDNTELLKMLEMWRKGDLDGLSHLSDDHKHDGFDKARDYGRLHVIEERNVIMANAIEPLVSSGTVYLVAVGALHLAGPKGIPALLRQRGYVVTRAN